MRTVNSEGFDKTGLADPDCSCHDGFKLPIRPDDLQGRGRLPYSSSTSSRKTYLVNKIKIHFKSAKKDYFKKQFYLS